jgi:UDP-N-acetylglucosamine:LPS N-acetylglucosamine transferase
MIAAEPIPMPLATETTNALSTGSKQDDTIVATTEGTTVETESGVETTESHEKSEKALKVLFLSSDTGGGHRASAESLAKQFELLFPGSTYALLDVATESYLPPYNKIVPHYKHLSANPSQWKIVYGLTNSRFSERGVDLTLKFMSVVCERSVRKKIKSYEPDVVVSVHPLQTNVPILSCAKISHETGKHLPMFTVVTDLGSAHCTWFANGVEKMFVGSSQIYKLAKVRGKVPDEKLVQLGLPIRHDFAVEAEKLGYRMGPAGKQYQRLARARLQLPATDRKTLLVMGGGEGVGSLSNIVDALYCELVKQGIDAVIMVVCGRNETLKNELETRDWAALFQKRTSTPVKKQTRSSIFSRNMFTDLSYCGETDLSIAGCIQAGGVTGSLRRILSSGSLMPSNSAVFIPSPTKPMQIENGKTEDASGAPDTPTRRKLEYKSNSVGAIQTSGSGTTEEGEGEGEASVPEELNPEVVEYVKELEKNGDELVQTVSNETLVKIQSMEESAPTNNGKVDVVGLGFVTNMAEYMVAADILLSKAGPGTISEAAALSLPVMLTSFLPGQEERNIDYVVDGGFGAYCADSDPQIVAEEISEWLTNDEKMMTMSEAAKKFGAPYAARDIVQMIGDSTLKWREHNENAAPSKSKHEPIPATPEAEAKPDVI